MPPRAWRPAVSSHLVMLSPPLRDLPRTGATSPLPPRRAVSRAGAVLLQVLDHLAVQVVHLALDVVEAAHDLAGLDLRLDVDLVIDLGHQPVLVGRSVLAHHDDR